jgi:hypothetical protein
VGVQGGRRHIAGGGGESRGAREGIYTRENVQVRGENNEGIVRTDASTHGAESSKGGGMGGGSKWSPPRDTNRGMGRVELPGKITEVGDFPGGNAIEKRTTRSRRLSVQENTDIENEFRV